MSNEFFWFMHVSLDFLHTRNCAWRGFHPHHAMLQPIVLGEWSIPGKRLEEAIMSFGEENNYLPSPIPLFQVGVDLGAASWIFAGVESGCERTCCENRATLVVGNFCIDMSFTSMVDCISSMLWADVEPYILQKKMILLPEWCGN